MTDAQLYLAVGIPSALFALNFLAILWQSRSLERTLGARLDATNFRIDALQQIMVAKFEAAHQSLLRVEGVLDARLKHVEETLSR